MKRAHELTVLLTLLTSCIYLSILHPKTYASTASSDSFRIDRPQVIIQNGSTHATVTSIQQRTSPREAQEFYDNGMVILYDAHTRFNTTIGTQLVELDHETKAKIKIPLHTSSKADYEFIHVRRGSDLHHAVQFNAISQLNETGISGSIHVSIPPELSKKKSYLGTLKVILGAY